MNISDSKVLIEQKYKIKQEYIFKKKCLKVRETIRTMRAGFRNANIILEIWINSKRKQSIEKGEHCNYKNCEMSVSEHLFASSLFDKPLLMGKATSGAFLDTNVVV